MKTKLFFTVLALVLTAIAGAQNIGADKNQQNPAGQCLAFVDANKNGICDNFENRMTNVPAANSNSNCRGCAQRQQCCQGMGQGMRQRMGRRMGPGKRMAGGQGSGNFVDANKNGVCDFYESAVKK